MQPSRAPTRTPDLTIRTAARVSPAERSDFPDSAPLRFALRNRLSAPNLGGAETRGKVGALPCCGCNLEST